MTPTPWYVIRTNPLSERKAASNLRRIGVRVYIPKRSYQKRNRRTGARWTVYKPLMAGYVLIRFKPDQFPYGPAWFGAMGCQGVRGVLTTVLSQGETEPYAIPASFVASLMRRQRNREFDDVRQQRRRRQAVYRPGAKMAVTEAHPAFAEFHATITRLINAQSIEAEIDIFGRKTKVRFDDPDNQLRPLAKSPIAA